MIALINSTRRQHQQGFTLIEVLIAVIVLSVGLLGLAGLQAMASKLTHSAYQYSQAASLAYEIVDAIRANAKNAVDYKGTHQSLTCKQDMAIASGGSVAENDLAEWKNQIACVLPSGSGTITLASSTLTVTLNWSEERVQASATPPPKADARDEFTVVVQI